MGCRQYSCCLLIPSVSWGARLIACFHVGVCLIALASAVANFDHVSIAVTVAELAVHCLLLYGVSCRRKLPVLLWIVVSLVVDVVVFAIVVAVVAVAAVSVGDGTWPEKFAGSNKFLRDPPGGGEMSEETFAKARQVAVTKLVLISSLAVFLFWLEMYYVLVVWSFYKELQEESSQGQPSSSAPSRRRQAGGAADGRGMSLLPMASDNDDLANTNGETEALTATNDDGAAAGSKA